MVSKQSVRGNVGMIPRGIGLGLAASLICTFACIAIGASLLNAEIVGEKNEGYITVTTLLFSSIIGAVVSVRSIKEKRVPVCLLSGGAYLLSLLAITALFFGGVYDGVGESALVILAGALSVALLGLKESRKAGKRRRKNKW